MAKAQLLYDRSPIAIQNILCSLYGFKTYKRRHLRKYESFDKLLKRTSNWSKEEINEYSNRKFREIFQYAYNSIPYYKNKYDKYGINISQIQDISDIKKLPIVTKVDMRKLFETSDTQIKHITINTSGSTGTPFAFHVDDEALNFYYALWKRYKSRLGITKKSKKVTFGGKMVVPLEQHGPPFWRMNYYSNQLYISTQHLSPKNIPSIIDKLIDYKPEEIFSYPSALNIIATYASGNIDIPFLKEITVTSENLLPGQRELFEKTFNCPVYQTYGLAEPVIFFTECEKKKLHHNFEFGHYEIVDNDGSESNEGEIVVTGYYNKIMPFIRYSTSDIGRKSIVTHCGCGQHSDILEAIDGRVDDYIFTPEGNQVGRMSHIFKGQEIDVIESQFVQNQINSLDIYIVKGAAYTADTEEKLTNNLKERLGEKMKYNFHYVATIPKTKSGKLRTVVSKLDKNNIKKLKCSERQ